MSSISASSLGGRQVRVFPVALIQDEPLIQQAVVQQNISPIDADLAYCGVRAHLVQDIAAVQQSESNVVQVWCCCAGWQTGEECGGRRQGGIILEHSQQVRCDARRQCAYVKADVKSVILYFW